MKKFSLGAVAVVPFWSNSDNMNADSNYSFLRTVLPEMEKLCDDRTIFLLFFPDPRVGSDRWYYIPDGLESKRIVFIRWPYDTRMQTGIISFQPDRIREIEKKFGVNGYWLHQVEMGSQLQGGYEKSFTLICRPWIVAQHHYVIHKSLPYPMYAQFTRLWQQMGGTVGADHVVLNSQHTFDMMQETFQTYLNDDQMNEIGEKSTILRFGLIPENRQPAPEAKKGEKPIFIYNHRFEAYKQPHVTWNAFNELKHDHDFEIWASQTPGQATGEFIIDRSVYEPTKEKYLERISIPAINTINSLHETFCISMLDSISLGHLCVVPAGITFEELLPDGYPYIFQNSNEQIEMLRFLLENFVSEYNKWRMVLHDHAKKNFGLKPYVKEYLNILQTAEIAYQKNERKDRTQINWERFVNALESGATYRLDDLRKNFAKVAGLQQQAAPSRRLLREMIKDDLQFSVSVKMGELAITMK